MNHPYWRWLAVIGFLIAVPSGAVSLTDKIRHDPTLWGVALIAFTLGLTLVVVGLLLEYKPWRRTAPSLEAQANHDFVADIRESAKRDIPTAIKDLVGILIKARQKGRLFTGAEYAKLRAILDHPDRWPFRREFSPETRIVGADPRLAVGHAIALFFLPLDEGTAKMLGVTPTERGDIAADIEAVLGESPLLLSVYWRQALLAVADRLDKYKRF